MGGTDRVRSVGSSVRQTPARFPPGLRIAVSSSAEPSKLSNFFSMITTTARTAWGRVAQYSLTVILNTMNQPYAPNRTSLDPDSASSTRVMECGKMYVDPTDIMRCLGEESAYSDPDCVSNAVQVRYDISGKSPQSTKCGTPRGMSRFQYGKAGLECGHKSLELAEVLYPN